MDTHSNGYIRPLFSKIEKCCDQSNDQSQNVKENYTILPLLTISRRKLSAIFTTGKAKEYVSLQLSVQNAVSAQPCV